MSVSWPQHLQQAGGVLNGFPQVVHAARTLESVQLHQGGGCGDMHPGIICSDVVQSRTIATG